MDCIVVGVDGSDSSNAALRWAVGAAMLMDAELVVASATATEPAGDVRQSLDGQWAAAESGCRCRTTVVEGDARRALLALAASEDAGLVVVGVGEVGWFPAVHLGSVSHYLVQHADRPVCVVPLGHVGFDSTRIVVGLDGSPGSIAAVTWAAALAERVAGTVHAVYAWQAGVSLIDSAGPNTTQQALEACRAWVAPFAGSAVTIDAIVEEGLPARVVSEVVRRSGAGVLVVGTRGAGGFGGLRLGSVALRLLQNAIVPIVVVPPGA